MRGESFPALLSDSSPSSSVPLPPPPLPPPPPQAPRGFQQSASQPVSWSPSSEQHMIFYFFSVITVIVCAPVRAACGLDVQLMRGQGCGGGVYQPLLESEDRIALHKQHRHVRRSKITLENVKSHAPPSVAGRSLI